MALDCDKYIGTPFLDGGRDISHGLDCWGLIKSFYKDTFDIDLPEYHVSAFDIDEVVGNMDRDKEIYWERLDNREEGCVVAMAIHPRYPDMINHVGVMIGTSSFLHTQKVTGAIISPLNSIAYSQRIRGYYKWVG